MKLKSDAEEFKKIIAMLIDGRIEINLPVRKRKFIPRFVYHFTDINNAISILESGYIYSRKKANELGIMAVDNASRDVINNTNDKWKSYVRFYFRPKTPTQYRNEGIRSRNNITIAHCPVPIFFLFDSKEMLTREDSCFSFGNLAVTNEVLFKSSDFKNMPFEYIYHEGSYDNTKQYSIDTTKQYSIKVYRQAELLIPEKCSLHSLRAICCRSSGEKETFLNLLNPTIRNKYHEIVFIDTRNDFYNGEYTYVEEANLTREHIVLSINKGRNNPVFKASLEILEHSTNINYTWKNQTYQPGENLVFNLNNLKDPGSYQVKFYLDDNFAYYGSFVDEDRLPF